MKGKLIVNRYAIAGIVFAAVLLQGCDRGAPDKSGKAAGGADKPAVGRCAVDAKDGAPYGKIVAETVEPSTNERMYRIESKGATWNKKAANVRVVDC